MDPSLNLSLFHLNQKWLDLGILTKEKLEEMASLYYYFKEDYTIDFFRRSVLSTFLKKNHHLDPEKLNKIFELVREDTDHKLGKKIMEMILKRNDCPRELLEKMQRSSNMSLREIAYERLQEK
jgi:hypothetical protein